MSLTRFAAHASRENPSPEHRPGIWHDAEGAVRAMNQAGEVQSFGFNLAAAAAFAGGTDHRLARNDRRFKEPDLPTRGRTVLWVLDEQPATEEAAAE